MGDLGRTLVVYKNIFLILRCLFFISGRVIQTNWKEQKVKEGQQEENRTLIYFLKSLKYYFAHIYTRNPWTLLPYLTKWMCCIQKRIQ